MCFQLRDVVDLLNFHFFWKACEPSNSIGDYYFVFDAFNKLHMILVHKVKKKHTIYLYAYGFKDKTTRRKILSCELPLTFWTDE